MKRDLVSLAIWTSEELSAMFSLAHRIKRRELEEYTPLVKKSVALIFERQSLRTRVSFEVGVAQLGGHPIFLPQESIGISTRESVHDIATVLSRYNECIVARTVKHQTVVQLAESASVPVINAMTDLVHPCQILADAFTLQEMNKFGPATKIVFMGDGNNIANSWLELAEKMPLYLVISCPAGYEPHPVLLEQARRSGVSRIELIQDPIQAVKNADVLYTDVWPAVRGSREVGKRRLLFKPYQINSGLLEEVKGDCCIMHRLPANRGEEITHEVLDGRRSIVLQQAENRLHMQKGILAYLLEQKV